MHATTGCVFWAIPAAWVKIPPFASKRLPMLMESCLYASIAAILVDVDHLLAAEHFTIHVGSIPPSVSTSLSFVISDYYVLGCPPASWTTVLALDRRSHRLLSRDYSHIFDIEQKKSSHRNNIGFWISSDLCNTFAPLKR